MASAREQIKKDLNDHGHAIDELHRKLAAHHDVDKDRLQKTVDKYKRAYHAFVDDIQGCMI